MVDSMLNGGGHRDDRELVFVSMFNLEYPSAGNVCQVKFRLPSAKSPALIPAIIGNLWKVRKGRAIIVSNAKGADLLLIFLSKLLYGRRLTTFTYDLNLRVPKSRWGRLLARIRRGLLRAVDVFICMHKDVSGYTKNYGILPERCEYVPFKPNNWDLVDSVSVRDGDYVVALGASHRDYRTLLEAVKDVQMSVKIILPRARIKAHNADIGESPFPDNVQHLETHGGRVGWNQYLAESRLVVIPILADAIQPAGISVYLEAMALGKPVVITRGVSTEGILDERLAVLVPPGNPRALREAIVKVWNDEPLRRSLGAAGKEYARSLGDHKRLVADIRDVIRRKCRTEASAR
ncbi:MAG: glycosyltransferase family 4 protein [Proteobacteria bacterium]|nr:glycosyltransferase family 4 protein [Pseudomonadota bacterium]